MKNFIYVISLLTILVLTGVSQAEIVYIHNDALGSPMMETNELGAVISRTHYKPFGGTLEETKDGVGYTGHLNDADLGLTYMQARYYDPVIGRFYSNDPVGYIAENPVMSFNRYMYVNNNPYKYTDPNGELLNFVTGAVGALIGGVSGAISARISTGDWSNSGSGFVGGAIAGGIIGATFGAGAAYAAPLSAAAMEASAGVSVLSSAAIGSLSNAAGDAIGQLLSTGEIENPASVGASLVTGVAGAFSTLAKAAQFGVVGQALIPATLTTIMTPVKDAIAKDIDKAVDKKEEE